MASHFESRFCNKRGYKTKKIADEKLDEIAKYPTKIQRKDLNHSYKCSECGLWHLTSMSKTLAKTIQKNKEDRESLTNISKDLIEKRMEYLKSKNKFKK